ncbi:MAG: YibE/F family protein [Thermoleophilaceae bacterium]
MYAAIVAVLAVATVVGMVVLWPGNVDAQVGETIVAESETATVLSVEEFACSGFESDVCREVTVRIDTGADSGKRTQLVLDSGVIDPEVSEGDELRVIENVVPPGADPVPGREYSISDFDRQGSLLLLVLVFAGLVVLFGRLRGAMSLVGLGLSLAIVLVFMVPAILAGKSTLAVAVVGAVAVMIATILLAHGTGPKSLAAIVGTAFSLIVTVSLAVIFTDLTHLTGVATEEAALLQINDSGVSLQGLLLAGMIIAALGVLDDVTVSQSSTVLALRAANPSQSFRELFLRAMDVGRDHVSATVNTLVLAYVGASLPLMLIFSSSEIGFADAVNLELIAKEIVATLVGSIGLIAAVPITTALAALLAGRMSQGELAAVEPHGHAH